MNGEGRRVTSLINDGEKERWTETLRTEEKRVKALEGDSELM